MANLRPMDTDPHYNDRTFPLDPIRDIGCYKVTVTSTSQTLLELTGLEALPEGTYCAYVSFSPEDVGRIHYNPVGVADPDVNGALYNAYPILGPDLVVSAELVAAADVTAAITLQTLKWHANY
jgi:hypothetical protein